MGKFSHTLLGTITYPTKSEKENHRLKSIFGVGYVSFLEGLMPKRDLVFSAFWVICPDPLLFTTHLGVTSAG